jgi:hypothetical protein
MRIANTHWGRGQAHAQRIEMRGGGKTRHAEIRGRGKSDHARVRVAEHRELRGRDRIEVRGNQRRGPERVAQVRGPDRIADVRDVVTTRGFDRDRYALFADRGYPAGFVGGCPPGLAKKTPACVPPGRAKNEFIGSVLPTAYRSNLLPLALRDIWRDDDDYYYRYGDGYVYRVDRDRDLIDALYPLIGAGYGIGQPFPYMNNASYYVPSYYQPFYPDTPYADYRYANGYVYQIDPYTGLVEDMVPLLDRGYGVGQMLPASYSYYNVPYQYRSLYYDTPDYAYRYAPGAIYQVDPQTSLITSVASLLAPGLSVGQPLPVGYSAYNVPYAYRDTYYDTPDAWYRYSNGYVYQVDPTTQIVQAIVASLLT